MICTNIRNLSYVQSILIAIVILMNLSNYVSDDTKLKLICPYLCYSVFEEAFSE